MEQVTYLEFHRGDPEPAAIPYVIDRSGDTWAPGPDRLWTYGLDVKRSWEYLVENYGPVRVPVKDAHELLLQAVKDAEDRLAEARAMLNSVPGVQAVFAVGDPEPTIDGLTLRDRDGDIWRYDAEAGKWGYNNGSPSDEWVRVLNYAPLRHITR